MIRQGLSGGPTCRGLDQDDGVGAALGAPPNHSSDPLRRHDQVAQATTLPLLMRGASKGDPPIPWKILNGAWAGANVRGAMVAATSCIRPRRPGRGLNGINKIIHAFFSTGEAVRYLAEARGQGMDLLRQQLDMMGLCTPSRLGIKVALRGRIK